MNDNIAEFTKHKLPAFFEFAKDKNIEQIDERNDSFVNKLYNFIPNHKIDLRWLKDANNKIEPFNYLMLKHDMVKRDCPKDIIELYAFLTKKYGQKVVMRDGFLDPYVILLIQTKFSELKYSDEELVDYLIDYLYGNNKRHKSIFWLCYGNFVVTNLKNNLNLTDEKLKVVQCVECGEYFEVPLKNNKTCRCFSCQSIIDDANHRRRNKEYYERINSDANKI